MSLSSSLALSASFPLMTAGKAAAFPLPFPFALMTKFDDDLRMVGLSRTAIVIVAAVARWPRALEADCKSSGWEGGSDLQSIQRRVYQCY